MTFISSSAWIADRGKDEEESQARIQRDRVHVYTRKRFDPTVTVQNFRIMNK